MSPLDHVSAETSSPPPDLIEPTVARLREGEPFTSLLIDEVPSRLSAAETVVREVADPETRVVQITNPLRSALSLERVFMQAVGPEVDLRIPRTDEQLARLLARPLGKETKVLLVIHQPETLDIETREILSRMAAYFPTLTPRVQILFCGATAFQPPVPLPEPDWTLALATGETKRTQHRLGARTAVVLFVLTLGFSGTVLWQDHPGWSEALGRMGPHRTAEPPAVPAPVAPAAAAEPSAVPVAPPAHVDDFASLRREFDGFLAARAPALITLSQAQKDALIQEFLDRRRARPEP
jgi:hypothetical protein